MRCLPVPISRQWRDWQIRRIVFIGLFSAFLMTVAPVVAQVPPEPDTYACRLWQVGQYAEYQVIHLENEGRKNRYRISLVGQEIVNGKLFFWQRIDIWESRYYITGDEFVKNLTILALVEPVTSLMFRSDAAKYIRNGVCPNHAVRLKVQLRNGPFVEVDPAAYFSHQDIIETTAYTRLPDAAGKTDFSRMRIVNPHASMTVPAGEFVCRHILVETDATKEYHDEGLNLWRHPDVPFLGIVKMDFSITRYWEKRTYQHNRRVGSWRDFIDYVLHKRIPGRDRADTYIMQLLDYGPR